MRNWCIGFNDVHKTATYYLEEGPAWAFWLRDASNCGLVPKIPFPTWLHYYDKETNSHYTWREWYGDLSQWFHVAVCDPTFQFSERRIRTIWFDEEFEQAKTRHPKEFEYCITAMSG